MLWVFVFGGIALAGLGMIIAWIVWLVHKASDVFSEVTVLADRSGQILDLLAQISLPAARPLELPQRTSDVG